MQFQGKRVSRQWHRVLTEAAKHVHFQLNSGKRTMREQWYLYRNRGKPGFAQLVAYPSPNAPHIRVGRQNHCLDVDTRLNGNKALAAYLARHGVHVKFNVAGEPWHMDPVNGDELQAFYLRLRDKDRKRVGLRVSSGLVQFVADFEGFRTNVYRDAVGVETIGYGETNKAVIERYRKTGIPEGAARRLLRDRLNYAYGPQVRKLVKVPLTQRQYDALVSFTYNLGAGALASSTLLRELNAKHYARAANEFLRWDKAGGKRLLGLTRRRQAERKMFLRGSKVTTRARAAWLLRR